LRIPDAGLTLSDAVESSLRPGIASQAAPIPVKAVATSSLPVGAQNRVQADVIGILSPNIEPAPEGPAVTQQQKDAANLEIAGEFSTRTNDIERVLFRDNQPADRSSFSRIVHDAIAAAFKDGAFKPVVASNKAQTDAVARQKTRLYQDIMLNYVFSDVVTSGVPSDDQLKRIRDRIAHVFGIPASDPSYDAILANLKSARDRGSDFAGEFALTAEARRDALIRLITPPAGTTAALPPVPGSLITPSSNRSIADDLAVILSRQDGRRIIIPLQFVRTFRPGDIRLAHGDRIHIVQFPQPENGTNAVAQFDGAIGITSWLSKEGIAESLPAGSRRNLWDIVNSLEQNAADAVILRRASVLSGIDEFILPADDSSRLSNIPLQDLDLVHLDMFALNPLTQAGSPATGNKNCCAMCGKPRNSKSGKCCNPVAGTDQQLKVFTGVSVGESFQQAGRAFQDTATGFSSQLR
jgi:hypothetical protein